MKFNKIINDWDDVIYTSKNNQNQIMTLSFDCWKKPNKNLIYYVEFKIGKRGRIDYLKQTGRDGLSSLLWAKSIIKLFIEDLEESKKYRPNINKTIIIQWDDNKRKNVYIRGLKDLGFKYGKPHGYNALYYIV